MDLLVLYQVELSKNQNNEKKPKNSKPHKSYPLQKKRIRNTFNKFKHDNLLSQIKLA